MGRRVLFLLGGLPVGGAEANVVAVMPLPSSRSGSNRLCARSRVIPTVFSPSDWRDRGLYALRPRRRRPLRPARDAAAAAARPHRGRRGRPRARTSTRSIFGGFATRALPTRFVLDPARVARVDAPLPGGDEVEARVPRRPARRRRGDRVGGRPAAFFRASAPRSGADRRDPQRHRSRAVRTQPDRDVAPAPAGGPPTGRS